MINKFVFVVSFSNRNDSKPVKLYKEVFYADYYIDNAYRTRNKLSDLLEDYGLGDLEWDMDVDEYECNAKHTMADGVSLVAEIYQIAD